jgi:hypothetical protein
VAVSLTLRQMFLGFHDRRHHVIIGAANAVFHDADPLRTDGATGLGFAKAGSQEKKI